MGVRKRITNKRQKLKGKVEEGLGHALHDDDLIVEGKADQTSVDLKEAGKKVKDAAKSLRGRR